MIKQLICKECGQQRNLGRKLCKVCNSKRVMKSNMKKLGTTRCEPVVTCEACKNSFRAHRKSQRFCSSCWKRRVELSRETLSTNQYVFVTAAEGEHGENNWAHRRIAETILKRKLRCHEIVHHMDDNPKNNHISNLAVMLRSAHCKLHKFLDDQRVILEKSGVDNLGNCWDNLIIPMTTAWLETTGANVIKLWELGQSAAEPL